MTDKTRDYIIEAVMLGAIGGTLLSIPLGLDTFPNIVYVALAGGATGLIFSLAAYGQRRGSQ